MSFFSNPSPSSPLMEEGTVVQLDIQRSLCKVKTLKGQLLQDVTWALPSGGSTRGSIRVTPSMGDRVIVNFGLGYPIITNFIPRIQSLNSVDSLVIGSGEGSVDMGSYGPSSGSVSGDQNKPDDMVGGDTLVSSSGGATVATLKGGSALMRAGRGAEVFLFNWIGLVRIVSRNWAHFTDLSSDVIKNFNNRLYRYTGYSKSFSDNKNEDYKLHFYYGDVKAAETIKAGYDTYTGTPATDSILYKEQVSGPASIEYCKRTYNDSGEMEILINNGTHVTRIVQTAEQVQITWNNQNIVTITEASIHAVHKDGADLIMDSSSIRATFGGSVATIANSQATITNGAGSLTVSPSTTSLVNGGHSVIVSSSGVSIS